MHPRRPPFLIGLSGPTSSGKTTIATALNAIFPPSFLVLVHADDFFKPDSSIPLHSTGVQDWDCAGALDVLKFRRTLLDIKNSSKMPEDLVSQGGVDDGVHGSSGINQGFINRMREELQTWPQYLLESRQIVLVEGFLLFGASVEEDLGSLFDLKVLLRATRAAAKARRESRNGYVTLEGFWEDPKGYFDDVVWPNFVKEHALLFINGDVEGSILEQVEGERGGKLVLGPVGDVGMDELCRWVIGCVRHALEEGIGDG